ncbi:Formylmethanofuran dehydrogenase subunit E [Gaiella occulta]|uniref:Formylmethanofuran dehydrogenase subunit E n=1 Tax=Gaiella occulta TaxID=1002870 RepID=A0A7M2Z128_9ACTN|nr:FmdE family protein [Gaiella occulta]RDI75829.1 Formylmethanofuran dehydrogenase subunit E [Gaiella occulta]
MIEQHEGARALDDETVERVVAFHGHMCPGLAMGIQASLIALREIGAHAMDEEVVAAVETDMCGVDAIQFLTGCTFGKGNLVHRDYGKNAYTFWRRSDGKAIRISGRPAAWGRDPEHEDLFKKVRLGAASDDERERFQQLHVARARAILETPPEELFEWREVRGAPPRRARIHSSVVCADCGEGTMEIRIRRFQGRELCPECFEEALASGL